MPADTVTAPGSATRKKEAPLSAHCAGHREAAAILVARGTWT